MPTIASGTAFDRQLGHELIALMADRRSEQPFGQE